MRFKVAESRATVYAVAGTHVVSIALDMPKARRKPERGEPQLFGFGIARRQLAESAEPGAWEREEGYKFFPSMVHDPKPGDTYSTFEHHWQSFIYSDFLAEPATTYEYAFHPFVGVVFADRAEQAPITIVVTTEPLKSDPPAIDEVYFNRGVASSQAYVKEFGREPIANLDPDVAKKAMRWLSRGLDDAMVGYVHDTQPGESLLCCLYEFSWEDAIIELVTAVNRGVDVRLILDYKGKETIVHNPENVRKYKFPPERVIERKARHSHIAHNKFMVRTDHQGVPTAVWTGSTNVTLSALTAQTNVAHVVHDQDVAAAYAAYWNLLSTDPGGKLGDDKRTSAHLNREFIDAVEQLSSVPPDFSTIAKGTTVVFSPRRTSVLLDSYAALMDAAMHNACITLPFNEDDAFRVAFSDNTHDGPFIMVLLNKEAKVDPNDEDEIPLPSLKNNVYSAFGAGFRDPVSAWLREAYPGKTGLGITGNVDYIHSKVILVDPLSANPVVVTGSANFSVPSLKGNDENSLVIRGDKRVGDIYFTEFVRLFEHYLFRTIARSVAHPRPEPEGVAVEGYVGTPLEHQEASKPEQDPDARMVESQAWTSKYHHWNRGGKRLEIFRNMSDTIPGAAPSGSSR